MSALTPHKMQLLNKGYRILLTAGADRSMAILTAMIDKHPDSFLSILKIEDTSAKDEVLTLCKDGNWAAATKKYMEVNSCSLADANRDILVIKEKLGEVEATV